MVMLYLGIDDGHNEIKVDAGNGESLRFPSHGKAGSLQQISLSGGSARTFTYETPQGSYVTGELNEIDSTSHDEYPVSTLNRVLVTHALREAGIVGQQEVSICTGLPIKHFYRAGKINAELIKAKRQNLLKNDVSSEDVKLPIIVGHEIMAEGIAAWMDLALVKDSDGKYKMNKELMNEKIAIIDIGGRTTDIALVSNGVLELSRSSTLPVGMLAIGSLLSEKILEETGVSVNTQQLDAGLKTGKIKLWGENQDIAPLVNDSKLDVVNRIETECKRCLGNASDIDRVIFVGGTVMALGGLLDGWFRNQSIGHDPAFANARGMQKYAEFYFNR